MDGLEEKVDTQEEQKVEQPDTGTPQEQEVEDPQPEFYLDDNGDLQWNTDDFDEKEEGKDSEPEPAQEQEEEQPEETQPDEDNPKPEEEPKYKVKVDGEEIEVTQEELLRGYMRQRDYTQKTQQLAQQRKQFEQYRPQYQQQPQVQQPQQQDISLNDMAKEIAARNLGLKSTEDLSELDFDHITAVVEAKQALLNQRNAMMYRQQNIDNLENQLRNEEPKYDEIMANINDAMQNLPVSKFNKLKQAYSEGNPEPLREFFKEMQKEYYSHAIQKVEEKKKPTVPKVESSANTPIMQTKKQNRIDFKQFGHLSTEQKAKILLERGFLD